MHNIQSYRNKMHTVRPMLVLKRGRLRQKRNPFFSRSLDWVFVSLDFHGNNNMLVAADEILSILIGIDLLQLELLYLSLFQESQTSY